MKFYKILKKYASSEFNFAHSSGAQHQKGDFIRSNSAAVKENLKNGFIEAVTKEEAAAVEEKWKQEQEEIAAKKTKTK